MKIAVSATAPGLDSGVDPRLGRCRYFIVVDPESLEYEAVDNPSASAGGGAGISAAQMLAGKGIEAVLTGNCGPNAYQALSSAGIRVITGVTGRVSDAVQSFNSGELEASPRPNVPDHFGAGYGAGR